MKFSTMKFSTMIPMNYNDGTPVHIATEQGVYRLLWSKFGGCTVDAIADGYWQDDDGKLFKDKVRRVTVVCRNTEANLNYARLLVRRIGVLLRQKAMYFEHDAFHDATKGDVEFLTIDPDEDFTALFEK